MITIENVGRRVILFGRKEDGTTYVKADDSLKPYFYYEDWKGTYSTIDGKRAVKVECRYPGDVNQERMKYPNTYEADVRFVNRYIIDKMNGISKEPMRICYLDIETKRTENGYESPELATNPIIMVGCKDSFTKERKRFILKDFDNEREMLDKFLDYITLTDPDIIIAWNGDGFDFPFLINRMKRLKVDFRKFSRLRGDVDTTKWGARVFGRVLFDLMRAYQKINAGEREQWNLDYISRYELKEKGGKEKYKGELDDLYEKDIDKFIKYNDRDVDLLEMLNDELKILDFFDEVRRLCHCKIEDVFMNTKIADCLCLKYAKDKYVLPSSIAHKGETILGGYVRMSEPRLHKDVAVMDMKSLYPSIMIGFNISYETIMDKPENDCISIDDVYFFKKEKGIIPAIVKPLLDKRKEVAKKMNIAKDTLGMESQEYKTLWMSQYALKVIANSFYGVLLKETFRLYRLNAGKAITYTAQKIIKEVHKWFEDKGLKVIYGDTDSIFLLLDGRTKEQMIELNRDINQYFKEYFRRYGVADENNIFKLEFEKICKTILFKIKVDGKGVKKKYACRVIWNDGKDVDCVEIKGFEAIRSDNPTAGRALMKRVLEMILHEKSKEEIDSYVEGFRRKILNKEISTEDLGFPIGISKPLDRYGNHIHARASKLANRIHKAGIKQGDKIKYIFVKNIEGGVIAFKQYMYDGYELDYNRILIRIIDMKIGPLYESLGWQFNYMILPKKKKEVSFEKRMKQIGLWR